MRFRPFIGLTIVTAICLAILIGLGTWQKQRLAWKTQLLADIQTASQSAPFESVDSVFSALERKEPIDYRRIVVKGDVLALANNSLDGAFHVFEVRNKTSGWRVFQAFEQAGDIVYVDTAWVPDSVKDQPRAPLTDDIYVAGYIRTYEAPSRFAATNTPELNRWFSFNPVPEQADWAEAIEGRSIETRFYIDAEHIGTKRFDGQLDVRVPDIPNNHFDYMLTWYSFALILFVIYILLHIRGNRLTFRAQD